MEKNNRKKAVKAAMLGSVIGAAAALLLAPKSGEELRQDLRECAHDIGDKAVELKEKAQSALQTVEQKTQKTVNTGKGWLQKGKQIAGNLKTLVYEIQNGALTKTETIDILAEEMDERINAFDIAEESEDKDLDQEENY